jgi:hypothetical protein
MSALPYSPPPVDMPLPPYSPPLFNVPLPPPEAGPVEFFGFAPLIESKVFDPPIDVARTVLKNLLLQEKDTSDDKNFTGHVGRPETIPYMAYVVLEQQKTIDLLTKHLADLTNQVNELTKAQYIKVVP